jgi:hypothetical protein
MTETTDETAALGNPSPPPMPRSLTAFDGLTVRDFLSAAALQGLLAAHTGETALPDAKKAAQWAREYSDALLKELSNTPFAEGDEP